jgi:hypothetical protein
MAEMDIGKKKEKVSKNKPPGYFVLVLLLLLSVLQNIICLSICIEYKSVCQQMDHVCV